MERIYKMMPEAEMEEAYFLDNLLKEKSDQQVRDFLTIYRTRRRDPQITLLTALIGFLGISGIHRFLLNQIGMGILYLLTGKNGRYPPRENGHIRSLFFLISHENTKID